jgi:hypothetical protein
MCELLLDVDVVIKLAAYDLLTDIAHPGCGAGCERRPGVTAATKYVALSQLKRRASNADAAIARLDQYLASTAVLEPTEPELQLAAKLESEANCAGLALDTGESQLCAMAILRAVPAILTGDKRAIAAAESLAAKVPQLWALARRVACLEQAVTLAVARLGALAVRDRVLAEKEMDKAISICFQFANPSVPGTFEPTGLTSYINSVRSSAPTLMMPGECLAVPSVA